MSIDSNVEIEFELEIEDAHRAPVLVGGTLVGQITVVGSGEGKLEMSTDPDIDQVDLPVDFPSVEVGTTVLVEGLLEGTFAVPAA